MFRRGLCGITIAALLAGCGPRQQAGGPAVVVWHWMTDRDEAFQQLAQRYAAATGQAVRFELYAPSEVYTQKVRGAIQTNTLPDIFGVLGETRDLASFINSGYILNLTDAMRANDGAWEQVFYPKALEMNRFVEGNAHGVAPGTYGVPIDVTTIQLLYNKALFRKAGLDPERPPQTWAEFLAAGRKLKAAGIPVLVSGFGETWLLDSLASDYAWNVMGKDKVIQTYRGEVAYTDPGWLTVLDIFRQMRDEGLILDGAITMVNKRAEQIFANNGAAFAFNGSWSVNVYRGMNPDLEYGVLLPPAVSDEHPMVVWGGAGSSLLVNAHSPRAPAAVQFLQWLTDAPQQQFLVQETRNLPSNRQVAEEIPPELAGFARAMDHAIHPNVLPAQEFSIVIETFDKGLQSILIGEKTPQQVASEVQQVKARELARRRQQTQPAATSSVPATAGEAP